MLQLTRFGGAGPRAYFIHGFGSDSQSWIANVPSVFGIVEAIGIDLPAHGLSAHVPVPETLEQIAAQVIESVDTSDPCVFVGHSAGGAIAMLCAMQLPVSALCLISPAGLGAGVNGVFLRQLLELQTEEETLQLLQSMVANKRLVSKMAVAKLLSQLQTDGTRERWQYFADILLESQQVLGKALQHITQAGIPTQIHWGKNDTINPMSETDPEFVQASWRLYEDCGHVPHIEYWAEYNDALVEFIKARS